MKRSFLIICLIGVGAVLISGCASIIQGTRQNVGISSTPSGATVCVDNKECGKTPCVQELSRKDNHFVTITLDGYMPYEITLTKSVSGWIWGNIIFGGLIGLVVDAVDGAMYKLTPEQINAELVKQSASYLYKKNSLFVAVVLEKDPAWQKIGELERLK